MLQDRLGISERRACRYVGQHRSTQRHEPVVAGEDQALRGQLRQISRDRPRWGYRRAHQLLLEQGWELNRKRTQRLWREEGLRVPQRRRKRLRLGDSTVPAVRLRSERPDHVWALDYQFDQTADGRILKLLHVVDEFTREALAIECRRRIDSDHTVSVLERLVTERGTVPTFIRCDNGPELTANALRDWCRFSKAGSAYIQPGSPWQNPYVESFGSRIRDELLGVELFSCLTEAQVLIEDWRQDYNQLRPHSALGMMTPSAFGLGPHLPRHPRTALAARRCRARARWNNNNQQPPALTAGGPMNGVRSPPLPRKRGPSRWPWGCPPGIERRAATLLDSAESGSLAMLLVLAGGFCLLVRPAVSTAKAA
jgi:putative transposase